MLPENEIENTIQSLRMAIDSVNPEICFQFPIKRHVEEVKSKIQFRTHTYFSRERINVLTSITSQFGTEALALYQKLGIAHLIKDSQRRAISLSLPEGILRELGAWFKRVVHDFSIQEDSYYQVSNINFNYDVGVCCLKSLPVGGAWFVQVRRIGLQPLWTLNIWRLAKLLSYLLFRTGGFTPFCVIHTVPRYILRFNCRQMNLAYGHIEALLKFNPKIKGIYRRSWLLDSGLKTISPNLAFLREVPEENGAVFFPVVRNTLDIRDALALSPHRKKLYEEGKYMPAPSAYIWPRRKFLSWAENNRDSISHTGRNGSDNVT